MVFPKELGTDKSNWSDANRTVPLISLISFDSEL